MSNFIPAKRKLLQKITPGGTLGKILRGHDVGYHIGNGTSNAMNPKIPDVELPPPAPTIDDAQANRNQQDRMRRRRGVLANIYAGSTASSGSASTTLGG